MNVKITEKSVTFKITEEEMNDLLAGHTLEKKIPIGQSTFSMRIDPNAGDRFEDLKEAPLKLVLDGAESCLMLCVTPEEIQKLSDMGRSREGLSVHADGLDVYLQVDLKADSRPRQKKG